MIVRRIPPKESREGGFKRLGQYITAAIVVTSEQGSADGGAEALGAYLVDQARHSDRVEWTRNTNCQFADNVKGAIAEIEATQARNTRMRADPNYHLLVSFPPGELPKRAQIEAIEDTLVAGLGLAAYQRISALHADKAHLHLHVAISLIHPETHRAVSVWKDYEKLQQMAARLEVEHGLERTDHTMPAERGRGERTAMEAHTAQEPFTDWVKRVAGEYIKSAGLGQGGWQALHEEAAIYGLEIRQRGAGLVIGQIGEPALNMKVSDLDRGLGFKQLVARFGEFEPAGERVREREAWVRYTRTVPPAQRASNGLWERYAAESKAAVQARAAVDAAGQKYLRELNTYYKGQYAGIKRWRIELFDPRVRSEALRREQAKDMEAYRAYMKRNRPPLPSWPDWLRAQAERGDKAATAALHGLAAKRERVTPTLISTPPVAARVVRHPDLKPKVTRGGDIVYRMPDGGTVVDKAEGLHMPMASAAAAMMILDMASERAGGQPLSVNGTKAQAAAILEAAVELRAPVTFADPVMEAERQSRVAEAIQAEKAVEAARARPAPEVLDDELAEKPQAGQPDQVQPPAADPSRDEGKDLDDEMEY